jgi:hypothetical protein
MSAKFRKWHVLVYTREVKCISNILKQKFCDVGENEYVKRGQIETRL